MPSFVPTAVVVLLLAGLSGSVPAAIDPSPGNGSVPSPRTVGPKNSLGPPQPGSVDAAIVASADFLRWHPDLRFRRDGIVAYDAGDHEAAFAAFLEAARHADKASQAILGEMYWKGEGVPRDPVRAYAWMDLAAERGYPAFVAFREHYWNAMTQAQRALVVDVGTPLYAEYGDATAKPRMERLLRKRRFEITGSHAGHVDGAMKMVVVDPVTDTGRVVRAFRYYQPRYWHAPSYYAWQDELFDRPATGVVEVGPLRDASARGDEVP